MDHAAQVRDVKRLHPARCYSRRYGPHDVGYEAYEPAMNARSTAFGSVLRRFREAAGLSQERLAERAGLSLRGVSDLERGVRSAPRLETVCMLADGLGLSEGERAELLAARNAVASPSPVATGDPDHHLTPPLTTFFGRQREIAAIGELLTGQGARLVTLIGPGGVGKTRLAFEVGHQYRHAFPDGVIFISLATVRERARILPRIANAIGTPHTGDRDLRDALAVALEGRRLLLILDNLEQAIAAAADVATLVARCSSVTFLATSRIMLHIGAERAFPVDPLPLPAWDAPCEVLAASDAVRLFADRARAVDPGFTMTPGTIGAVAELVRRLDGLPLAIELAAVRARLLSPADILARMTQYLPMLTGGSRDAPERQQTMRNAIAWSHDLLSPTEQAIFRRLAVFQGGCTLDAAESVLGATGLDSLEILDGLAALVESSLLQRRTDPRGGSRFRMLSTVRAFAMEQLAARGEETMMWDAAFRLWLLPMARRAEPLLEGQDQIAILDELEGEHDNLRAMLAWLSAHGRMPDALDLAGSMWFYWWIRGHYALGHQLLEQVLAHPVNRDPSPARARALIGVGVITAHQGDPDRSLTALREAVDIARAVDDGGLLAPALLCYGTSYLFIGQIDEGERLIEESRAVAVAAGRTNVEQGALMNLALIALNRGRNEDAWALRQQVVGMARAAGNAWCIQLGVANLGWMLMQRGELDCAERHFTEAREIMVAMKNKRDLPALYRSLADVARLRGDLGGSIGYLREGLRVSREIGDRPMIAECTVGLASLRRHVGDLAGAMALVREAVITFHEIGDDTAAISCLDVVADIAACAGDLALAAWSVGAADGAFARSRLFRLDASPDDHQARVDALVEGLGEAAYQAAWQAGYREDLDPAFERALAWSPPSNAGRGA